MFVCVCVVCMHVRYVAHPNAGLNECNPSITNSVISLLLIVSIPHDRSVMNKKRYVGLTHSKNRRSRPALTGRGGGSVGGWVWEGGGVDGDAAVSGLTMDTARASPGRKTEAERVRIFLPHVATTKKKHSNYITVFVLFNH